MKGNHQDFPGDPVVKDPGLPMQGRRSLIPGWGTKISRTVRHGQKVRKRKDKEKVINTSVSMQKIYFLTVTKPT